ncbi:MAG: hypothetical protein ACHQ1D_00215 [Nitrososphaerales archaeon]
MNKVGLLIIATGKYDCFIEQLLRSVDKHFFYGQPIDIYLFVDNPYNIGHSLRMNIVQIPIEHKPFPYATLYRYKYFDTHKSLITSDYIFYLDVDMRIEADINKEIIGDIVCVQHPGFYKGGWGSASCDERSLAYLAKDKMVGYMAGGFQGGSRSEYLEACCVLRARIDSDEMRGVMAEWHDETHWNWYLKTLAKNILTLDCSYCYPEAKWFNGTGFTRRIVALDKNHDKMRS